MFIMAQLTACGGRVKGVGEELGLPFSVSRTVISGRRWWGRGGGEASDNLYM